MSIELVSRLIGMTFLDEILEYNFRDSEVDDEKAANLSNHITRT